MRSVPEGETPWALFLKMGERQGLGGGAAVGCSLTHRAEGAEGTACGAVRGSAIYRRLAGADGEGKCFGREKTGALGEDWVKSAGDKLTNTHSVYYNRPCDTAAGGEMRPRKHGKFDFP